MREKDKEGRMGEEASKVRNYVGGSEQDMKTEDKKELVCRKLSARTGMVQWQGKQGNDMEDT